MDDAMARSQPGFAGKAETGRACPYCRFPLKEGIEIVECGVCHAPHHGDCWQDNGGCAVVACAGGPAQNVARAGLRVPAAATVNATGTRSAGTSGRPLGGTPPTPTSPPLTPPAGPQYPASRRSGAPWLIGAVVLLAVALAGVAVAFALGRRGGETKTVVSVAQANASRISTDGAARTTTGTSDTTGGTVTSSTTNTDPEAASTSSRSASTGVLPDESQDQMTSDIQQVLLQFHQDISTGDWQDAWNLLSGRKQQQSLRESGYNGWIANQKSLGDYLDPSGLQVSIVSTDPGSGVATVDVTGMTWSPPGRSSCLWSGITWVKYESGSWHYDPGYSTTPQRRSQWGPPSDTSSPAYANWAQNTWPKLMGGRCVSPS